VHTVTARSTPGDEPAGLVAADPATNRQHAVASLGLGEIVGNPRLDRVTRLAQAFFDVPISAVTILDGPTAWHPSVQGADLRDLPVEQTFCHQVSKEGQTMIVPDASVDPRFAHLGLVADGSVKFYAGRPLRDPAGNILGAFCIVDSESRTFDLKQAAVLEEMAQLAEQELLTSTENAEVSAIQTVLQPSGSARRGAWAIEAACIPALAVGGDFFDYHAGSRALMVGVGDVMGKGTSAALLGATVRGTLRGSMPRILEGDLGTSFTAAATALHDDLDRAGSFVTAFGAVIDAASGDTRYLDAGSGLCLLRRADGSVEQLAGDGHPLGLFDDDKWFEQRTNLGPGDRLMLFSDGLLDLVEDQAAWHAPLGELLATHDDPAELVATVRRLVSERTGLDDVTVVVVYRSASA
jgi:phosphoserine phosphatase RsbU/P